PSWHNWLPSWLQNRLQVVSIEHPLMQGDVTGIPVLLELLTDRDQNVRLFAAEALGRVGQAAKPVVPRLLTALNDPDPDVRDQVIDSIYLIDPDLARATHLQRSGWIIDRKEAGD